MNTLRVLGLTVLLAITESKIVKREPQVSSFGVSGFNTGLDLANIYNNEGRGRPSTTYGIPHCPNQPLSTQYGALSYSPQNVPYSQYGAPSRPQQGYGVPHFSSNIISQPYGLTSAPTGPLTSYGPPPSSHFDTSSFGNQFSPSLTYNSPPISASYDVPSVPSPVYGTPSTSNPLPQYGTPSSESGSYHGSEPYQHFGGSLSQGYDASGRYVY